MKKSRKLAAGIGVLALIGAALWMRELASWRPVVVAKVGLTPTLLRFSRDGRFLLVEDDEQAHSSSFEPDGIVLDAQNGWQQTPELFWEFDAKHGVEKFPRVERERRSGQLDFLPQRGRKIVLSDPSRLPQIYEKALMPDWNKSSSISVARHEIAVEAGGEIFTFDWSGKLKKRLRYSKIDNLDSIFSPSGKLLLTVERIWDKRGSVPMAYLRLFDVQSGHLLLPHLPELPADFLATNEIRYFGFSPDEQLIWFCGGRGGSPNLTSIRIANSEVIASNDSAGPVKWLADGRLGIVEANSFRWRNARGDTIEVLPGPSQPQITRGALNEVTDWVLSPDGKWIYSAEENGIIRRWRAR